MIKINFDQLILIREQFKIHLQQAKMIHPWKNHPFICRDIDKLVREIGNNIFLSVACAFL
ncbi:hypothetical protein [Rickettsiella massiliensis]|uniref:hypothetical protein n=1 Tax=Rickettsiella massiliensis TaxID=676517 RepID=UPI0002EC4AB0|nr:hypothetical protein [Rickettsiella massiliensis]